MLHIKSMMSNKRLSGILLAAIFLFGIGVAICVVHILGPNAHVISHKEEYLTPFESITTTVCDLGDGFTSTRTTTTDTTITSVKHSDETLFSAEQWNEILSGIASGNIAWED